MTQTIADEEVVDGIRAEMVERFPIVEIDGAFHVTETFTRPPAALWPHKFASRADAEAFLDLAAKSSLAAESASWRDMFAAFEEMQRLPFVYRGNSGIISLENQS